MPTPCARCRDLPSVLQRRRDHDFGLLELLDRLVAGRGHRRAQRAEQIERAVVLVRGADEDLASVARWPASPRAPRAAASGGTSPCPSGSRGPAPRTPSRAASRSSPRRRRTRWPWRCRRRFACRRRRSRARTRRSRRRCSHARAGGVGDGGRLRHADAEHAAARARVPRADADQHADGAGSHRCSAVGTTRIRRRSPAGRTRG